MVAVGVVAAADLVAGDNLAAGRRACGAGVVVVGMGPRNAISRCRARNGSRHSRRSDPKVCAAAGVVAGAAVVVVGSVAAAAFASWAWSAAAA